MTYTIMIGTVKSMKMPDAWQETPDDRQELIKIIGGVYVQDNGIFDAGSVIKATATFSPTDFVTLKGYWTNRTLINVVDKFGITHPLRRVKLTGWEYLDKFNYFKVSMELWAK